MGAYLSNGGKSFICLSSTVTGKDGTVKSRIVPTLTQGSIATDPRSCVQYLVTEYGMVNLKKAYTWRPLSRFLRRPVILPARAISTKPSTYISVCTPRSFKSDWAIMEPTALGIPPVDRKIISKGMGYFSPIRYSELPRFYRENVDVDVVMVQTTPMDAHGNFSFALAASHLADMMDKAKTIIVEVNRNMPWVYGLTGSEINIKDVDFVVEGGNPPIAQLGGGGEPSEVDKVTSGLRLT